MIDFWTPERLAHFWDGFVWKGEHLLWMRSTICNGYGRYKVWYRDERVHRVALELYLRRPIAPGMLALHTRDCPFRNCARFEHLYEGTPQDNSRDLVAAGHHGKFYTAPRLYRRWGDVP